MGYEKKRLNPHVPDSFSLLLPPVYVVIFVKSFSKIKVWRGGGVMLQHPSDPCRSASPLYDTLHIPLR